MQVNRLPLWKSEPLKKLRARRKAENSVRMLEWHNEVVERARVSLIGFMTSGDLYECFHCEKLFPRNEVCGDHWPHTKGARPDLKYDVRNGRCTCRSCNRSDNPNRKVPTEEDLAPFYQTGEFLREEDLGFGL